jgi:hypothetical protein
MQPRVSFSTQNAEGRADELVVEWGSDGIRTNINDEGSAISSAGRIRSMDQARDLLGKSIDDGILKSPRESVGVADGKYEARPDR